MNGFLPFGRSFAQADSSSKVVEPMRRALFLESIGSEIAYGACFFLARGDRWLNGDEELTAVLASPLASYFGTYYVG